MTSTTNPLTYETALLQFRPVVSSEERVNVGVIVFGPETGQVVWRYSTHYQRLTALFPELKGQAYRAMLRQVNLKVAAVAGPRRYEQGNLFLRSRNDKGLESVLREILPQRNDNFSWSSVRTGVCVDLEERAEELFNEFIRRFEERNRRERLDDAALWESVRGTTAYRSVEALLRPRITLRTTEYEYTFAAGWQNGVTQLVEPISLDYADPRDMLEEANRWRGRLSELARTNIFGLTVILSDPPEARAERMRYDQATAMLQRSENLRQVFTPSHVHQFAELVHRDVLEHEGGAGDESHQDLA